MKFQFSLALLPVALPSSLVASFAPPQFRSTRRSSAVKMASFSLERWQLSWSRTFIPSNSHVVTSMSVNQEEANASGESDYENANTNESDDARETDSESTDDPSASSAALEWARQQEKELLQLDEDMSTAASKKGSKKFVVVGAGWAGWGAAKALCQSGVGSVILLDALPDPTGRTPYVSPSGKPVEAGTRGFWIDYPNINELCRELGLDEKDIWTAFTNSSFYSPDGLEATAPVFSTATFPKLELPFLSQLEGRKIPYLPSPLGQVASTITLFERIPLADRASMLGLLVATVDCLGSKDEAVQAAYDRMTAHELFIRFRLSDRLVQDFIMPTLLVGLFKPPDELSALVVMELLYYYALAHTDSFDVRWIKNGTVADSLIAPMATKLEETYGLNVLGSSRVNRIATTPVATGTGQRSSHRVSTIEYTDASGSIQTINDVAGVVLSTGSNGYRAIVGNSPDLARYPVFTKAATCGGIDVISVRLWLDRIVPTRTPANVWSRYDALRGAGATFFMLDQLQSESTEALWGRDTPQGSVVACDFYNAGALLAVDNTEIIRLLMEDLLPSAVPAFADAVAVDSWVGRYPGAVSWFSPGSFDKRPPLEGAGPTLPNLKCAGDWVRMGEREHGAKGLCQERAFVSGLEAANSLLRDCGAGFQHEVLPVRPDEAQFQAAVALNGQVMKVLPRFWVR